MTGKYFLKGIIIQIETPLIPGKPSKPTLIIETEHPTKEGLFRGHYTLLLTSEHRMVVKHTGSKVLCEISEDKKGNHNIDHIYVDVEDL